jgi:HPt (histidine-containing phosphotransfer) domain-containing protein
MSIETPAGSERQYQELLEFVYRSPFALARIDETGTIDMMNSMGANLLMDISPTPEISNLLDVLDSVDPGVRKLVAGFTDKQGSICEGHQISIEAFGGGDPIVLSLNLLKLGPGRIMAAFGDISKLEAAQRAQRFLLDNVSDGLVAVDAAGMMPGQCSAMLVRWLGAPVMGEPLWSYLERTSPHFAAMLKLGWEAMVEDVMPLEVCLDQLPSRLDAKQVPLGVSYQPLMAGGKLTHVLVVMRDLTAQLERQRLDAEQRELMSAVSRLSSDRDGFRSFFDEASSLVRELVSSESEGRLQSARLIHTLKGNASLFGISSIAHMCHEFEDRLGNDGDDRLDLAERTRLTERWEQLSARFKNLIGDPSKGITLSQSEYQALQRAVSDGASRAELLERLELSSGCPSCQCSPASPSRPCSSAAASARRPSRRRWKPTSCVSTPRCSRRSGVRSFTRCATRSITAPRPPTRGALRASPLWRSSGSSPSSKGPFSSSSSRTTVRASTGTASR